jgi:hypothetical protein
LFCLDQEELGRRHGGADQGGVRLTFVLHLAQNTEVRWESVLWQGRLYLQVPSCLLPEGSKEGFVSILEYAEDVLQCKSVILCLKKDRSDRGKYSLLFFISNDLIDAKNLICFSKYFLTCQFQGSLDKIMNAEKFTLVSIENSYYFASNECHGK